MQFNGNKLKIAAQSAVQQGDYVPPGWLTEAIHSIPSSEHRAVWRFSPFPWHWFHLFTSSVSCCFYQLHAVAAIRGLCCAQDKRGGPLPWPGTASAPSHPAVTLLLPGEPCLSWTGSRNFTLNSCCAHREMDFKFLSPYNFLQDTNFFSSISLCVYFALLDDENWLMGTLIIAASKWQASGKMIITYSKGFIKLTYPE